MAKKSALVFGIIFIIVGILGFISNPIIGVDGYFHADTVHNIVHLLIGIILALVASKASDKSGATLKIVGVVYLLVAVLGFVSGTSVLGIFEVNTADNWLHVVLGVVILALGFAGGRGSVAPAPMQSM
jgi:hypothetical protein